MIVTDRFVFLHLHKSGGTFANDFLLRFVPNARIIGYHLPRMLVPKSHFGMPLLGFVRDPWSYYVSWFHFQNQRQRPNALFAILSEDGRLGFDGTIRNMLALGSGSPLLDAVLAALPRTYGRSGLNLPGFALAPIRDSGLGFYSHLYRYMYEQPDRQLTIARTDTLRESMRSFLEKTNTRVTAAMEDYLSFAPERNVSRHGPHASFYSDDLAELVASRDALVVKRHGYRFEASAPS